MENKDTTIVGKCIKALFPRQIQNWKPNHDGFVVIGAGLPRTGTLSMQAALSTLLGGPCYHCFWIFEGTDDEWQHWEQVFNGQASRQDWIDFLEGRGIRAGVDIPIAHYFEYEVNHMKYYMWNVVMK